MRMETFIWRSLRLKAHTMVRIEEEEETAKRRQTWRQMAGREKVEFKRTYFLTGRSSSGRAS